MADKLIKNSRPAEQYNTVAWFYYYGVGGSVINRCSQLMGWKMQVVEANK
jgi:hypothetical protein